MVAGSGMVPWQAPAAQLQFVGSAPQDEASAASSATAQVPPGKQEGSSTPVSRQDGLTQNQNMSAAGKQLFSEALEGEKIDPAADEKPVQAVSGLKVGPMESLGAD